MLTKTAAAVALIGSLLVAPSALASDPAPTPDAGYGVCADQAPSENPFLSWGDTGTYFLTPGGDFEAASASWALADGASLQTGYSPEGWGTSLNLPEGATALSPPLCVADNYTHGRMFGQADHTARKARARVEVDVLYSSGDTDSADVRVHEDWDATRRFRFDVDEFEIDPITGTDSIQLMFEGEGPAGAVLDGVYVDPTHRH